jgi:hypothetical protein
MKVSVNAVDDGIIRTTLIKRGYFRIRIKSVSGFLWLSIRDGGWQAPSDLDLDHLHRATIRWEIHPMAETKVCAAFYRSFFTPSEG